MTITGAWGGRHTVTSVPSPRCLKDSGTSGNLCLIRNSYCWSPLWLSLHRQVTLTRRKPSQLRLRLVLTSNSSGTPHNIQSHCFIHHVQINQSLMLNLNLFHNLSLILLPIGAINLYFYLQVWMESFAFYPFLLMDCCFMHVNVSYNVTTFYPG